MDYSQKLILYIALYVILMITTLITAVWLLRIIKMKIRSKGSLITIEQYKINGDILATGVWFLLFIMSFRTYYRTEDYMWKTVIVLSFYCCLFYFYRGIVSSKISKEGIYLKENFILWEEIISYTWSGLDFLTFKFVVERKFLFIKHKVIYKLFLNVKEKNLVNKFINKEEFDEEDDERIEEDIAIDFRKIKV
jgi:hypothetical protein